MCQIDELVFSLYLRRRGHLHMYVRPSLPPCYLGPAQLNMYEPVGSNRNIAYSPQCSSGARTPVVPPEMVQPVFYSVQRRKRVFSTAKKLITLERSRLSDDLIDALECLKA